MNTIAPYLITRELLPIIDTQGVVLNVSSPQAPVDLDALAQFRAMGDMEAYAQSKLALTAWSRYVANELTNGPSVISVNPGSLLATKMVKEGFGIEGKISILVLTSWSILVTDPSDSQRTGEYFDNDAEDFGSPHSAVVDDAFGRRLIASLDSIIDQIGSE